jgi:hypothetical protein
MVLDTVATPVLAAGGLTGPRGPGTPDPLRCPIWQANAWFHL